MTYGGAEGGLDVGTRGVPARMEDPKGTVRSLSGEGYLAVDRVERHSQTNQLTDSFWGFPGKDTHCLRIAQAGASPHSVPLMDLRRVLGTYGSSDAPLGVLSVAFIDRPLGEDEDTTQFAGKQGCMKPGDTAPRHDEVIVGHYQALRQL
jgi:hypothetical protein